MVLPLPKSWSKTAVLSFGAVAVAIALFVDDGSNGQVRPRSFAPVVNAFSHASSSSSSSSGLGSGFFHASLSPPDVGRRLLNEAATTEADHDENAGEGEHSNDQGLLFVALFVGMGVILNFLLDAAGKYFPLPYTVALVLLGALVGSLNSVGECQQRRNSSIINCTGLKHARCREYDDTCWFESSLPSSLGMLGTSIDTWVDIDPGFLLFFFIPALVYASAHTVDVHIFRESFVNVLTLAVPGVLMATYMMFAFFYYVYHDNPRYGWSFDACMCFGAILAATDPVAVVALLHDLGAPHKLAIAIEGESLLNDGTALVLFTIFSDALLSIERSVGDQFLFFFRLSLGGVGAGIIAGIISILCFQMMTSWVQETTWTIGAAYLTFFVCENHHVHFSGVLGVVFLGITVSLFGRTRIDNITFLQNFWTMWNFIANTLIFSITGAIVAESIFFEDYVQLEDFGTLLVVYGVQMVIRLLVLLILSPILYWSGRRNGYQLDHKELTLMWWSGLRGAVGLILALEVGLAPAESYVADQLKHCPDHSKSNMTQAGNVFEDNSTSSDCSGHWYIIGSGSVEDVRRFQALLTFLVAGFATLTLVINGLTTSFVVKCLGLTRKSKANQYAYDAATRHLEELMRDEVEDRLKKDVLYMHADWNKVWKAIPVHHWEESTCGRVRLQPFGKHWHQKLDEDDVDDKLEHTITILEQKLRVLARKLDDAREMRRNQILSRIDHFPEGMAADPHFQRIFSLYEAWAADKGENAAAALVLDPEADRRQSQAVIRSYSYEEGERPFVMSTAFPATPISQPDGHQSKVLPPDVAYVKENWGILQELRRRYLMLVSAAYWSSFNSGFVTADTMQDLQEISRHCLDNITNKVKPKNIKGWDEMCTWEQLKQFAIDDWSLLLGKFTRCQPSVKRCFNSHSEALRRSKFLDALTASRQAHKNALGQYRERYQRSMRKLDELRAENGGPSACALIFLGRQIVEDHPLLLDLVMAESEGIIAKVEHKIHEVQLHVSPNALATHQAVMHLLAVQTKSIHHMLAKGLVDHEEEAKLLAGVSQLKSDAMLRSMPMAEGARVAPMTSLVDGPRTFTKKSSLNTIPAAEAVMAGPSSMAKRQRAVHRAPEKATTDSEAIAV